MYSVPSFLVFSFLSSADNESIDPSSSELLQDKDVSKVEQVLSSLGNEATPDLGNSAVEAQGVVPELILLILNTPFRIKVCINFMSYFANRTRLFL